MNKKGGNVIRIVLGVYLIYLGVNIFIEVVQKNPANSGFMGVACCIFDVSYTNQKMPKTSNL